MMAILFLLIPIALALASMALLGFILSVRKGQYEDLETPAFRILIEDEPANEDAYDRK